MNILLILLTYARNPCANSWNIAWAKVNGGILQITWNSTQILYAVMYVLYTQSGLVIYTKLGTEATARSQDAIAAF